MLHGRPLDDVAQGWQLDRGHVVEPDGAVDAAAIRQAYAEASTT